MDLEPFCTGPSCENTTKFYTLYREQYRSLPHDIPWYITVFSEIVTHEEIVTDAEIVTTPHRVVETIIVTHAERVTHVSLFMQNLKLRCKPFFRRKGDL